MKATPRTRTPERQRPARTRYDAVVIGAGIAGLTATALLAHAGLRVLLLEAMHYPGGCASSFHKGEGVFDIGATTFGGTAPGQPLHSLFSIIGDFDRLLPAKPAMGIAMDGSLLLRHADSARWHADCDAMFSISSASFWTEVRSFSDAAYALLEALPWLPPSNPKELLDDVRHMPRSILRHLPAALGTVASRLRAHGLRDRRFHDFIDAQLLITSQSSADRVPFLAGALGLSYADYPVYAVRGGMLRYARFLEERARTFGAEIQYLQPVTQLRQQSMGWEVRTATDCVVTADAVVSALPVFNLPAITDGAVSRHYTRLCDTLSRRIRPMWGAITMYGIVAEELVADLPLNVQVILPQVLASCGSRTLFCSLSHPDDTERAPDGYRTMTISTHIDVRRPETAWSGDMYRSWKAMLASDILKAVRTQVPALRELAFAQSHVGTPRTFVKYTRRHAGLVGGIPLDKAVFPLRYPRNTSPFPGLYLLGDTTFPGQGLPGVTLGALTVHKRLKVGHEIQ